MLQGLYSVAHHSRVVQYFCTRTVRVWVRLAVMNLWLLMIDVKVKMFEALVKEELASTIVHLSSAQRAVRFQSCTVAFPAVSPRCLRLRSGVRGAAQSFVVSGAALVPFNQRWRVYKIWLTDSNKGASISNRGKRHYSRKRTGQRATEEGRPTGCT